MNRPGWNPGRRNRHVGTSAHGHGQNNAMVIPDCSRGHLAYFEQLGEPICVLRRIAGVPMRFFIQPPAPGWFHPCTVDDVCAVLAQCPVGDWRTVDFIVMRQSTRKQRTLCPVWGRAVWHFDGVPAPGPAVVLEAQSLQPLCWDRSLTPDQARELDRLRGDGHEVGLQRRQWRVVPTPQSLRHTLLYRTLLHEIGHHVDYTRDLGNDLPWSRHTRKRKEDFAHRYAQTLFEQMQAKGALPIAPGPLDEPALAAEGLRAAWFTAPDAENAGAGG